MRKMILFFVLIFSLIILLIPGFIKRFVESRGEYKSMIEEEFNILYLDKENKKSFSIPLETLVFEIIKRNNNKDTHIETLKAKAVIYRTKILRTTKRYGIRKEEHPAYDICSDNSCCDLGLDSSNFLSNLSSNNNLNFIVMSIYSSNVKEAVEESSGEVILYKGELIHPYFTESAYIKTENSLYVLNEEIPYLLSVNSEIEKDSPYVDIENKISKEDFVKKIKEEYVYLDVSQLDISKDVYILSYTPSKRVFQMQVGNITISGDDFRELLGLNSSYITDIKTDKTNIYFYTNGMGHGMGFSEYGANQYAVNGREYTYLILMYYTGVDVVKLIP